MIDRSGAWYTITSAVENREDPVIKSWLIDNEVDPEDEEAVTKAFKFQGMEKLVNFLNENEELRDIVIEQVRDLF